jgi:conjugative transposon TraM protein
MSANNQRLVLQQKKKMFLLMPVIVVPLLALLFNILGGGQASAKDNGADKSGINTEFPGSSNKESNANKLAIAEEAKQDEYATLKTDFDMTGLSVSGKKDSTKNSPQGALSAQKMQQINAAYEGLYAGGAQSKQGDLFNDAPPRPSSGRSNANTYAPKAASSGNTVQQRQSNFSYADEAKTEKNTAQQKKSFSGKSLIRAVVHGSQTIKNGSLVKLRILEDVQLSNILVPKNTLVYGQATGSSSERLNINIFSISVNNNIEEVKWAVYDLDGNEGINVPSNGKDRKDVQTQTVQDGANEAQNAASSTIGNNQAAQTGTRLIGNLFRNKSAKKNTFKVSFNSGYQIIIKIEED